MAQLLVSKYYKQMALIGKDSGTIKDTTTVPTTAKGSTGAITDDTGTFKLIDEMIRDLVKIKNDVKTRRDTKLLDVEVSNGGSGDALDDVVNFEGDDDNKRKQADIWIKNGLMNPERGINTSQPSYVPSVYKNAANVYISEGALFHTLRSSAYIIKKLKNGTKEQIKGNIVEGAVVSGDLLHN
jgi:hypothetical protein